MFSKLSKKALVIMILVAILIVAILFISMITALIGDEGRLQYELKEDGTYEVIDVKNAYRGGIFAKKTLVIPDTHKGVAVTSIKSLVLQKTENLVISEGIKSIGLSAFYGSSLVSVQLPSTLTAIGNNAFNGCHELTTIELPASLTSLSNGLFKDCLSLTEIIIPASVQTIGNEVFSGCTSLTSIAIPDGVTSIGNSVFYGCKALTQLTLPSALATLGTEVFTECDSLNYTVADGAKYLGSASNPYMILVKGVDGATECKVNDATMIIYDGAFNKFTSLTKVQISKGVQLIGSNVFAGCTTLAEINVDADNANYSSVDGILYNKGQTEFIQIPQALKSATIPETITAIPASAFAKREALESITLPSTLKSIGANAFNGCSSLTSVIFTNTAGWKVGTDELDSAELAKADVAATYLTETHVTKAWTLTAVEE